MFVAFYLRAGVREVSPVTSGRVPSSAGKAPSSHHTGPLFLFLGALFFGLNGVGRDEVPGGVVCFFVSRLRCRVMGSVIY